MKIAVRDIVLKGLNDQIGPLLSARAAVRRPVHGWLRAIRESTALTQAGVATKLGLSRQSYAALETSEARGAISLNSLQRAADAMDCEVVYFLVPRPGVADTFSALATHHDPDRAHLVATEHSMSLEGQAVGDLPHPQSAPTAPTAPTPLPTP
jgi:predicted DNA-binding mobile mystery protein A